MKEKCNKFESLFIFSDEETLMKHVNECDDCKAELEKMNRVSELIQEVKPHYAKKNANRFNAVKIACVFFAFVVGGATFHIADMNYSIVDTLKYGSELSAEEIGFNTDDYGLIMVDY